MQIKKALLALFLLPSLAFGTKIVSQQTGNWGDTASWVGGVIPGNGDEVSLFHVINVTDTRTIGVSVTTGSFAVTLNSTGAVHVTSTGHLIVRGYVTYTSGGANTNDAVDIDGGGAWEFDSSVTTAPKNLGYKFYPNGSAGYRVFRASGTATSYASLYSNSSSSTGTLTANGQTDSGIYVLYYTSVTNMAFDLAYNNGGSADNVGWNAQFSSFTRCNLINAGIGGNMQPTSTFRHEFNFHTASIGASVFFMNFTNQLNGGLRSIKNNFFDVPMNDINGQGLSDFNIQNNYMGQAYSGANSTWSVFTNNFIRLNPLEGQFGMTGPVVDAFVWSDTDGGNPHIFTTSISSNQAITGAIWEQAGISRRTGADDSGEFWLQQGPTIVSTVTISSSIFLANGAGYSSLEATSLTGSANPNTYTNNRFVLEHNTYFGGWDNTNQALPPFGMLDFSETANMAPGVISSFRSNLLWNPQDATRPAQFFKALDVGNVSGNLAVGFGVGPTQDVCSPGKCDYNAAYPVALSTATGTNTATYTNQGKGYAGKFSATPGTHDVDGQNPNFVDYKRYFEKFDSGYYRPYFGIAQPALWFSSNTYNQGDFVSHSSSTYFWGDTLNYVYVSTGFCVIPSTNPEPGTLPISNWTRCWQTASVGDMQKAILSSMTFTDASIGANNSDINQTLLKWVRAGYIPTNLALHGTAHDGGDIGAQFVGTAGKPIVRPSTAVVIVGATVQLVSTNAVTWSLKAGSAGSINSSGLYTAPTTYFTASNISPAGCPFRPNDDIVNTRIDNLPVDSSSTFRFAHAFTVDGGSVTITFEPTMPTNIYNSNTPLQTLNFRYTTGLNGTSFPLLSSTTRMEEGSSIADNATNDLEDHHVLGVDSNTCLASEYYGYYPIGSNSSAPTSNSESGFQYYTNNYLLPNRPSTNIAGGTDAAGMAIQPILLRFSELKSKKINHALRMTLNNANLYTPGDNGWNWPATDQAFHNNCSGGSVNCFHYGARLRLKSTFNCLAFSTPGSQAICLALQQYGAFLVDGGTTFGISMNYDVTEDTTSFNDIFVILQSSISQQQLEQVDESSLMVSTFSGVVNPSNAYVTPNNFAQVVVTNSVDGSTNTVNIALQPVTVGFGNPAYQGLDSGINVMAGTPQFQIPYWVNGATDTTATCSMTPSVGSLTSGCLYTAPTSQYNTVLITTVTVTSNIDPNHATSSFFMTIFSTDGIRVRAGPAISGSDTIPPYLANGNYQDPTTGSNYFEEPVNNIPNWNQRSTQGSASWPNQLYNNFSYGSSDKVFSAMVPPGTYLLQLNSGAGACCGDVNASSNSIDTQGSVFQSTISLAPAAYVPRTITTNLTVGSSDAFYWAIRHNVHGQHNFLSYWSLTQTTIPRRKVYLGTR